MYNTVSFRGIQPVYTLVVWNLHVPPRIHIFLWLLANNKTLTRYNLDKRQNVEDLSFLSCSILNLRLFSIYSLIAVWLK